MHPLNPALRRGITEAMDAVMALCRSAAAGFPQVDSEVHFQRSATCALCQLPDGTFGWDAHAQRCRVCGCYALKLHLATEHCPIGRW